MRHRRSVLYVTSAVCGFAIMAAEMTAGRLMAPYYGTSTMVWALLIGSVMLSLAVGHLIGGRLSRRHDSLRLLYWALGAAGVMLALLPYVARPIMYGSLSLFRGGAMATLVATFAGVTGMLVAPLVILGMVGPLLVHHAVRERTETGVVAGRLYALGTTGSLFGTFLPGVVLVPLIGCGATLRLCAGLLLATSTLGLVGPHRRTAALIPIAAGFLAVWLPDLPIKPRPGAIYETESAHNYIQVTDDRNERRLYLNDGYAVQSVLRRDGSLPLDGVWGYYAASPAWTEEGEPREVLLLGLGGGTSARYFDRVFPTARVTGVELDPEVIQVARDYFDLPVRTVVVAADARAFLRRSEATYDIVIVDAFRFPYVPFQLTTREFFADLDTHLAPGGVVVLNVGRDGDAFEVVDAVARTAGTVFPHIESVDLANGANTILVAARHPTRLGAGLERLNIPPAIRSRLSGLGQPAPRAENEDAPVLTDDRAPVELLTDRIILRRLLDGFARHGERAIRNG